MMIRPGYCLAFIFLLVLSCAPREARDDRYKKLDAFFSTNLPADQPGGAILVMVNGAVVFSKGYGLADVVTKEPITPATLFNLGSVSKTFVANGILRLAAEGRLSIDDPVTKYFAFSKPEVVKQITIRHLLTHTSGLPDIRNVAADTTFYLTAKDAENWAPILATDSLLFQPGTRFEYSNPAFNGLALIIEKVSGQRWQAFVEENIMRPAGMTASTITDGAHPESGVSHGYNFSGGTWIEDDYGEEPTFPASGNGGVWSSVEELADYENAIAAGLFISDSIRDLSRTVQTFPSWDTNFKIDPDWSWFRPARDSVSGGTLPFIGYAWFIETRNGVTVIGHTGSQGGFLANYVSIPERKVFFAILLNTPRDIRQFSDRVYAAVMAEQGARLNSNSDR